MVTMLIPRSGWWRNLCWSSHIRMLLLEQEMEHSWGWWCITLHLVFLNPISDPVYLPPSLHFKLNNHKPIASASGPGTTRGHWGGSSQVVLSYGQLVCVTKWTLSSRLQIELSHKVCTLCLHVLAFTQRKWTNSSPVSNCCLVSYNGSDPILSNKRLSQINAWVQINAWAIIWDELNLNFVSCKIRVHYLRYILS